jgi:hypothetical protein
MASAVISLAQVILDMVLLFDIQMQRVPLKIAAQGNASVPVTWEFSAVLAMRSAMMASIVMGKRPASMGAV